MAGKHINPDTAKGVHNLRAQNKTWKEIGAVFGDPKSWAYYVWRNFDSATGLRHSTKKGGPLRKSDPVSDEAVGKLAKALRRITAAKTSVTLKEAGIMDVSKTTIARRLKKQKVRQVRPHSRLSHCCPQRKSDEMVSGARSGIIHQSSHVPSLAVF